MRNRELVERINDNLESLGVRFETITPEQKIVLLRTGGKAVVIRKADVVERFEKADAGFARAAHDLDIVVH